MKYIPIAGLVGGILFTGDEAIFSLFREFSHLIGVDISFVGVSATWLSSEDCITALGVCGDDILYLINVHFI